MHILRPLRLGLQGNGNSPWCLLAALLVLSTAGPSFGGTIRGKITTSQGSADLASAVVYVDDIEGIFRPPAKPAEMNQKSLRFLPHVLPILVGTTVEFPNNDPLLHNVFSISDAKRFNLGLYRRGASRRMTFDKPGVVQLLCNVHLEMSAFIVVLKNPYFARPAADGVYTIPDVPAGKHRIRSWHEQLQSKEIVVTVPAVGDAAADLALQPATEGER